MPSRQSSYRAIWLAEEICEITSLHLASLDWSSSWTNVSPAILCCPCVGPASASKALHHLSAGSIFSPEALTSTLPAQNIKPQQIFKLLFVKIRESRTIMWPLMLTYFSHSLIITIMFMIHINTWASFLKIVHLSWTNLVETISQLHTNLGELVGENLSS